MSVSQDGSNGRTGLFDVVLDDTVASRPASALPACGDLERRVQGLHTGTVAMQEKGFFIRMSTSGRLLTQEKRTALPRCSMSIIATIYAVE